MSSAPKPVRIGNAQAFWGDRTDAAAEMLAREPGLHYLTLDYLAEVSMSILAMQKQRDTAKGYAGDFLDVLERLTPSLKSQPNLRIVTNAGGMNPTACAVTARSILDKVGLTDRSIAIVSGDDMMPNLDQLLASGHALAHLDTGAPLSASVGSHRLRVEAGETVVFTKTLVVHGGEQVVQVRGERSGQ